MRVRRSRCKGVRAGGGEGWKADLGVRAEVEGKRTLVFQGRARRTQKSCSFAQFCLHKWACIAVAVQSKMCKLCVGRGQVKKVCNSFEYTYIIRALRIFGGNTRAANLYSFDCIEQGVARNDNQLYYQNYSKCYLIISKISKIRRLRVSL